MNRVHHHHWSMLVGLFAGLVSVSVLGHQSAATPHADLRHLLRRTADYVQRYHELLGSVVAKETYEQRTTRLTSGEDPDTHLSSGARVRRLVSEFLLVRVTGGPHWIGFRDVLEVNGTAVPPFGMRLATVLRDSPDTLGQEWRRLVTESARFNLGGVQRTVNVPTFALQILRSDLQERFQFSRKGVRSEGEISVIELAFSETDRPTLVRTPTGEHMPLRGAVAIDSETGAIVRTEIISNDTTQRVQANIVVDFERDARLGLWVATTMTERYTRVPFPPGPTEQIDCVAKYSDFRRFEVSVRLVPPAN